MTMMRPRPPFQPTNTTLPGAFTFPDDFCFYFVHWFDDADFLGNPPAPCQGFIANSDVLGVLRNAALPNWPNAGVVENCPISPRFILKDEALTGQCAGRWIFIDSEDTRINSEYPVSAAEVDSWADYTTIPPYINPGPASRWYFDNITLDGSPTP